MQPPSIFKTEYADNTNMFDNDNEEPVRYSWVPLDTFDKNIDKLAEKFMERTNIIIGETIDFVNLSEDERTDAADVIHAVFINDKKFISETSLESLRNAGKVVSGFLLMSKLLRQNGRRLIQIPTEEFGLIFLADLRSYYFEILQKVEPKTD